MTFANSPRVLAIAIMPGDGTGPEVIDATVPLLAKLAHDAPYASGKLKPFESGGGDGTAAIASNI